MSYISNNWCIHTEQGQRKYITDAERACFLARADSLRPDLKALCYVLTYAGCRISEVSDVSVNGPKSGQLNNGGFGLIVALKERR